MIYSRSFRFLISFCIDLMLIFLTEGCNWTRCPGPLAYYDDLNCVPEYGKDDNCCAVKYDCGYIKNRAKDKCFLNYIEYQIGESIIEKDRHPCDGNCTCINGTDGIAFFNCTKDIKCPVFSNKSNENETCYGIRDPMGCCAEKIMCFGHPVPKCNLDGKLYEPGSVFANVGDREHTCTCWRGEEYNYPKENGYCKRSTRPFGSAVNAARYFYKNCTPVYKDDIDRLTNNWFTWVCGINYNAFVIKTRHMRDNTNSTLNNVWNEINYGFFKIRTRHIHSANDTNLCPLGNAELLLDDELQQGTEWSHLCLKCICDAPPVLTCLLRPKEECLNLLFYEGEINLEKFMDLDVSVNKSNRYH